jgi:hypothetical protein
MTILGSELRVGDTMRVWNTLRETVIGFRDYTGPIECLQGSRIADFASGKGMTISPSDRVELFNR